MDPKNEDDLKNEDELKKENNLKNEYDLNKKESNLKNEDDLENWPSPPKFYFLPLPSPWKKYLKFLLMTSHLDSHTTTDVKPEMIPVF